MFLHIHIFVIRHCNILLAVVNLPVRAFISIEKAIKSTVELRTEFNLAGRYSYSIDMQFLRNNLIGNIILNYSLRLCVTL
jgi:hypothetical protein